MSGHTGVYDWRYGDKLKDYQTTFPDETTVYYTYDGLGKLRDRCPNWPNDPVTWWRWDLGWNKIDEYTDSDTDWDIEGLTMTYVPGMAEIVGSNPATGTYRYYSEDRLGSVRRMRDANKASLATYEYDPYGGQYAFSGLALNHGFTGHTWEPDAGLYYAPFRYYSPAAARWLTRDPLGMSDGSNVYAYVGEDPIKAVDRLGLQGEWPPGSFGSVDPCECYKAAKRIEQELDNTWWKPGPERQNSGHMAHCLVSCKLAREQGQACALAAGWKREFDQWRQYHGDWDDIVSNAQGRSCASQGAVNCRACCRYAIDHPVVIGIS